MLAELTTEQYAVGHGGDKREVIRSRVKFVDRKGILELLGRWNRLKLWADTVELSNIFWEKALIVPPEMAIHVELADEHRVVILDINRRPWSSSSVQNWIFVFPIDK
jgi:hypothetical protein